MWTIRTVPQGGNHLSSGNASYTLHTYNAEDFPRLPDLAETQTFAVDREALLETIVRVARAASRDEARLCQDSPKDSPESHQTLRDSSRTVNRCRPQ